MRAHWIEEGQGGVGQLRTSVDGVQWVLRGDGKAWLEETVGRLQRLDRSPFLRQALPCL